MIAIAQKKGLYKNCYVSLLGGSHKAPIEDGKSIKALHNNGLVTIGNFC